MRSNISPFVNAQHGHQQWREGGGGRTMESINNSRLELQDKNDLIFYLTQIPLYVELRPRDINSV